MFLPMGLFFFQSVQMLGVFIYIIVRYRMKLCSTFHKKAEVCPQDWAIELAFSARRCPTSLVRRLTLLSKAFDNFAIREVSTLLKRRLRTLLTIFTVNSICARSALFSTLNHTPFRMALILSLASLLVIEIRNRVRLYKILCLLKNILPHLKETVMSLIFEYKIFLKKVFNSKSKTASLGLPVSLYLSFLHS
jgi:hypothetical protein